MTLAARGAWATETSLELGDIAVTAKRPKAIKPETAVRQQIEVPGVTDSLLENLIEIPGIQLKRTALSGNENGRLRLRGFGESRLRVLKNGVPIHRDGSYGNGPIDWSTITQSSIESVQVYKGAVPAKYGNTLGGVVDIITRTPEEGIKTEIQGFAGNKETYEGTLTHMGRNDHGSWFLSGGHFESNGFLRNNTMDRNHAEINVSINLPLRLEVGGGVCWSRYDTGMPVYNRPDSPYYDSGSPDSDERELGGPGISARLIDGARAWGNGSFAQDENTRFSAWAEKRFTKGHLRLDYLLWNHDKEETYVDAANPNHTIYKRETEAEPNNWALQGEGSFILGTHTLEAGGETRRYGWGDQHISQIDTTHFNGSINSPWFGFIKKGFNGQPDTINYHAAYIQDTWHLAEAWTLEAGVRQSWFKADAIDPDAFGFPAAATPTNLSETNTDPRVAFSYRPWKDGELTTRLGITHRYPTSPEYFWWYLNRGSGFFNTNLSPEETRQVDLIFTQSFEDTVQTEVRAYQNDINDYISSTMVPGTGNVVYNITDVTIRGAELSLRVNLPFNLSFWGNATWQEGEKNGDPWDTANQLEGAIPDFPEIMSNAGLDYQFDDRITARLFVRHIGKRKHLTNKQLNTLDAYTVAGANASILVFQNAISSIKALGSVHNIFDEHYEEEAGYPLPGITYTIGLSAEF